ncbi:hypothetical protein D7I40_10260 [Citrobacter sp. MH181794]|nr:hypothetical protein D7I40_10260 [Citrobacter sp. MH181794]
MNNSATDSLFLHCDKKSLHLSVTENSEFIYTLYIISPRHPTIAINAKDFAHFANFTAPLVGVKSFSNVFP